MSASKDGFSLMAELVAASVWAGMALRVDFAEATADHRLIILMARREMVRAVAQEEEGARITLLAAAAVAAVLQVMEAMLPVQIRDRAVRVTERGRYYRSLAVPAAAVVAPLIHQTPAAVAAAVAARF